MSQTEFSQLGPAVATCTACMAAMSVRAPSNPRIAPLPGCSLAMVSQEWPQALHYPTYSPPGGIVIEIDGKVI